MFQTKLGPFDGTSWENLCQLVFKLKHGSEGYQAIPADPGDFGLEGYTIDSSIGFQCYCPNKHYEIEELYKHQRDKITTDIGKLKTYTVELQKRLGDTKIKDWYLVTPEISRHKLLEHAKSKEQEARSWGLPILDPDFTIHLRDADFYLKEINQIRLSSGVALTFDSAPPSLELLTGTMPEFEANILRKSKLRVSSGGESASAENRVNDLYQLTLKNFLESDSYLKRIEQDAPPVFARVARIINEFEMHVLEQKIVWEGTPEALNREVKEGLVERLLTELQSEIDISTAERIARHIVARWLAVCQLDFIS
jgi:hypothetical protein